MIQTEKDHVPVAQVHVGTLLIADGGFTCIAEGSELEVKIDNHRRLFVDCVEGVHYLNGQVDNSRGIPVFVGFRAAAGASK